VVAAHHGQRLGDAFLVQQPGLLQTTAEAQHRLLVEDRDRIAGFTLIDDEADRVGAEIDDSEAWRGQRSVP
jgi:ABC-type hemin transport system substrate-binding protein